MKATIVCTGGILVLFTFLIGTLWSQVPTQNPGLTTIGVIPIPNWAPTGTVSFDLSTFNPLTRVLYYADRNNHGATAIDTKTNTFVGTISPPDCTGTSCPSGALVIPDLQKLVLTSRGTIVWIYDLTAPGATPVTITPVPAGIDELDYDPIHQRIYIGNTTAPFFLTAIDLTGPAANTIVASIPLPGAPEQPRFNPVDGFIYLTIPTVGLLVIDPNAGASGTAGIINTFPVADCGPQGNDIDPVTNTILVACVTPTMRGAEAIRLTDGKVLAFWPNTSGIDVLGFDPNNRRWYTGSATNVNNGGNCPSINTGAAFPVLGVYAAPALGSTDNPTLVGGQCSGRGGRVAGVDPIDNNIYVAVAQFPADPSSATTGQAGVLVFNDPTATQPTPARTQAILGSNGIATFTLQGRTMNVFARLQGLTDAPTRLVVTTTVGNEVVSCNESGGQALCTGTLIGDPLIGGVVLLGNNARILSKGTIAAVPALLVTGLSFDVSSTRAGSSYNAMVTGSNLTSQTFFDIRFRAPGSNADNVASNWQTGVSATHNVPVGITTGTWTITGVRAHQDASDHTGTFVSVSTTITVSSQ